MTPVELLVRALAAISPLWTIKTQDPTFSTEGFYIQPAAHAPHLMRKFKGSARRHHTNVAALAILRSIDDIIYFTTLYDISGSEPGLTNAPAYIINMNDPSIREILQKTPNHLRGVVPLRDVVEALNGPRNV